MSVTGKRGVGIPIILLHDAEVRGRFADIKSQVNTFACLEGQYLAEYLWGLVLSTFYLNRAQLLLSKHEWGKCTEGCWMRRRTT